MSPAAVRKAPSEKYHLPRQNAAGARPGTPRPGTKAPTAPSLRSGRSRAPFSVPRCTPHELSLRARRRLSARCSGAPACRSGYPHRCRARMARHRRPHGADVSAGCVPYTVRTAPSHVHRFEQRVLPEYITGLGLGKYSGTHGERRAQGGPEAAKANANHTPPLERKGCGVALEERMAPAAFPSATHVCRHPLRHPQPITPREGRMIRLPYERM